MTSQPRPLVRRAGRALFGSWLSALLACFAVVVPKCPLCAAAYLCLFGISASSARAVVALGLPLCLTLIAGSTLATALFVARRSRLGVCHGDRAQSAAGAAEPEAARACCAGPAHSARAGRGHRVHALPRHQ
ncbi:MAG TPA: hypothetical protein VFK05_33855 [Polyangiaceae bacterium]|nr:hypothetical protein [Polyangiaceae bacterium]